MSFLLDQSLIQLSTIRSSSLVQESIIDLCATGCVVEVAERLYIHRISYLLESILGKKRMYDALIKDLKYEDRWGAVLLFEHED